jgi:hypothetical protein
VGADEIRGRRVFAGNPNHHGGVPRVMIHFPEKRVAAFAAARLFFFPTLPRAAKLMKPSSVN